MIEKKIFRLVIIIILGLENLITSISGYLGEGGVEQFKCL